MTVKALKKQLMAAIAMVVVSAIALSSSTYAWFANNTTVKAQGISVNAASDSILLQIAGKDDGEYQNFGTVGTTTISQLTMQPTTSADGKNFAVLADAVKVESTSDAAATWSGTNGAFKEGDLITKSPTADDYTKYVATARYDLKCQTGSVSNVYVKSVSATVAPTNSKTISKSIRVSISCGDTTLLFNPLNGSYLSQTIGNDTFAGAGKLAGDVWTLENPELATPGNSAIIASSIGTSASEVIVRVWFEGQDGTCYTDNVDTEGISVNIEFATDATTVNNG
ncbi:MAG: hypothetical protein IJ794_19140 [Lachnospiraceae bacterium]|nr:hypothetical protein [Lachnospiraceae bacterium]MBR1855225.1 hypothetical protein [Lachnospiraceae bacterium]